MNAGGQYVKFIYILCIFGARTVILKIGIERQHTHKIELKQWLSQVSRKKKRTCELGVFPSAGLERINRRVEEVEE